MQKRTRVGDSGDHGGSVITGNGSHVINGRKQARQGDIFNCAIHGPNKIIAKITTSSSSSDYLSSNAKLSHHVSITECGARIITGSDDGGTDQ